MAVLSGVRSGFSAAICVSSARASCAISVAPVLRASADQGAQPIASHLRIGRILDLAHEALHLGHEERQHLDLEAGDCPAYVD